MKNIGKISLDNAFRLFKSGEIDNVDIGTARKHL